MKIIIPLVEFYEKFFKNNVTESIILEFNEKELQLFRSIKKGKITCDKQAAKLLYDGNPSGQAYSKFKQGFLEKLTRVVINYDDKNGSIHTKKIYNLQNSFHAFMVMGTKNITHASFALGRKTLTQAERLGEYEIGMIVARHLCLNSQIFLKDKKLGDHYWSKFKKMKSKLMHQLYVQKEYADLMLLTKKKKNNDRLSESAFNAKKRIEPYMQKDNLRAMQVYYQINYVGYAAISDHLGVIDNNKKAIEFFSNLRHFNKSVVDTLQVQLVVAYLAIGELDKAINYLDVETSETNDNRWFNTLSLKVRIFFSLQKYDEASEHIDILFNSVRFKQTELVFQEQMWLYKYYNDLVRYFRDGTKINTRKIRNNMTRIATDKSGQNIPLLIAEVIYSIQQNGVTAVYSEEGKLKNYMKNHLRSPEDIRAIAFIKFLINLPNHQYDKQLFADNLHEIREELTENPASMTTKPNNEIIPYEDLIYIMMSAYVKQSSTKRSVESSRGGQAASDH